MTLAPQNTSLASTLKTRARFLKRARAFFAEKKILEVDPCALVAAPPNDAHIDCFSVPGGGFLHTSPEYAMKKLLSQGSGDIYFLGHVFRKEELGPLHRPEFTMAEWYRIGISFQDMIHETAEFLHLFFGPLPLELLTYREAFQRYAGINYTDISLADLQHLCSSHWSRKTCLHYLMSHKIEPHLGIGKLTAIIDYPLDEAALASTTYKEGELVAERYEIYYRGVELCNGYHELNDPAELRRRFANYNADRLSPYPLDEELLQALPHMPDCCGVALGFDRALMLHEHAPTLADIGL